MTLPLENQTIVKLVYQIEDLDNRAASAEIRDLTEYAATLRKQQRNLQARLNKLKVGEQ